jgi:hypothetical protein
MPEKNAANQELEPNNQENEETKEDEDSQEEPREHYEHMVDDAILGVMDDEDESS